VAQLARGRLVDDASHDETAEIAEALPLEVIKNHHKRRT
jgi:glycosyltransferase involved in cell wall biosynthesis